MGTRVRMRQENKKKLETLAERKPLSAKKFEKLLSLMSDWDAETSSQKIDKILHGSPATEKVVQTELGEREYDLLSEVAKKEGLTIKEGARRALLDWSTSRMDLKDDPLFRLKPVRFKQKINSSEIDRFLYHAN